MAMINISRTLIMRTLALLGVAALCVAGAVALPPTEATAAFPGDDGLIAYADNGIWVINPDGSGQRRLTDNGGAPAWSPDGMKIAFERAGDVWVMNADGSNLQQITTHSATDARPSWSPDGAHLIFDSDRSGTREIWRLDYPKPYGHAVRITHTEQPNWVDVVHTYDARWSPTGDRLAVTKAWIDYGYPGSYTIEVIRTDGADPVELPCIDCVDPDWSPDGTHVTFVQSPAYDFGYPPFDVMTVSPFASDPASTLMNLTNGDENGPVALGPAWSPDGEHVAVYLEWWDPAASLDLVGMYLLRSDGTGQPQPVGEGYRADPDWQPVPPSGPGCTITGTPGDDVLTGTWRDDVICGLGGNDIIRALGGKDTAYGGSGNDVIYGNAGSDHLLGEAGNDTVHGGGGYDTVNGGKGRDQLNGNRGNDTFWAKDFWKDGLNGGPGTDKARIDTTKDTITSIEDLF